MQTIELSKTSQVRVERKEYKEKEYLDVRKWFLDMQSKEWKPTTKGINLPFDLANRIIVCIHEEIEGGAAAKAEKDAEPPAVTISDLEDTLEGGSPF